MQPAPGPVYASTAAAGSVGPHTAAGSIGPQAATGFVVGSVGPQTCAFCVDASGSRASTTHLHGAPRSA